MTKKSPVPERIRRQVQDRAQGRCEYCRMRKLTFRPSLNTLSVNHLLLYQPSHNFTNSSIQTAGLFNSHH